MASNFALNRLMRSSIRNIYRILSHLGCRSIFLWVAYFVCSANVYAQEQQNNIDSLFLAGIEAVEGNRYNEAIGIMNTVIAREPGFHMLQKGAAAYWLGKAYEALEMPEEAHKVWRSGVSVFLAQEAFDVQIMDAYLRSTFQLQKHTEFITASEMYLSLLEKTGTDMPILEQDIILKHIAQCAFLLPEDLQLVSKASVRQKKPANLEKEVGKQLVLWWRSQDPLPATYKNERIIEHLGRVALAEGHYVHEDRIGFDDRGKIFVRLGEPSRKERIKIESLNRSLSAKAAMIPENEYWVYDNLGRYAHYLFVYRGGRFQISRPLDLLPESLKSRRKVLNTLAVHEVYDQLAWLNPEYTPLFLKADKVLQEIRSIASKEQISITIYADFENERRGMHGTLLPIITDDFFFEAEHHDIHLSKQRARAVPLVNSGIKNKNLPVITRLARFLDKDGTTRTEIYWAVSSDDKSSSLRTQVGRHILNDRHAINLTVVQKTESYQAHTSTQRHIIRDSTNEDLVLPVYTAVVHGDTAIYHLALQWDQYMEIERPDAIPYTYIRTGTYQADSLQPLNNDPASLEMSDIVPLLAPSQEGDVSVREKEGFRIPPYLSTTIKPNHTLGLYFEVYNLMFSTEDLTHVTIQYEIMRPGKKGGFAKILGRGEKEVVSVETDHIGHSRSLEEYILLDQKYLKDSMIITVRVTDAITGQKVERMIEFINESGNESGRGADS